MKQSRSSRKKEGSIVSDSDNSLSNTFKIQQELNQSNKISEIKSKDNHLR